MAHEEFIGIAEQVIPVCSVGAQVQRVKDGDQLGQPVLHILARAQLGLVVEIGLVDDAFQIVGFGQPANDLIDLVADLLVALQRDHVGKAAAFGHIDERIGLVADVLHEQQRQHVVLVLRSVHAAPQLVAGLPERAIELGFFQCQGLIL